MPLTFARPGDMACIKGISGKDETRRRLESLGLVVGSDVMIVSRIASNLILNVKGSRIAIDSSLASRIII